MSDARVVQVSRHSRFGMTRYHPENDMARLAVDLAGTEVEVTDGAISILKSYGFTVEVVAQASETL